MCRQNILYDADFHRKPPFIYILLLVSLHVDTHNESPITPSLPHRNTLAQLKDAYTKLFEDYNELKEEKKKREVRLCCVEEPLLNVATDNQINSC